MTYEITPNVGVQTPPRQHYIGSPRRYGIPSQPDAPLVCSGQAASVLAQRLTQRELMEPIGRGPIRGAGAVRFGILPLGGAGGCDSPRMPTAGKSTPRGESVMSLLQNSASDAAGSGSASAATSASPSTLTSPRSGRRAPGATPSVASSGATPGSGRRGSQQQFAEPLPFAALPGGPESASHFRFGDVTKSTETVKDFVSPRPADTHLTASPARKHSRRFGKGDDRVEPSRLPAACLPTREGVEVGAALPSNRARDTVQQVLNSAGLCQVDQLTPSSGKVTGRGAPVRPTVAEAAADRAFGIASVRLGMSPPTTRRLTDSRNYGDEPSSRDLITGGTAGTVSKLMAAKTISTADEAAAWARRCEWDISGAQARAAFDVAASEAESVPISLLEFKAVVDEMF